MEAGSQLYRSLALGCVVLISSLSSATAQDADSKDPDRVVAMEYTINYQTSQGPQSISQCGEGANTTDACKCARSMAILGVPPGAQITSESCGPPPALAFCQSCPIANWPPPTPPVGVSGVVCASDYWVVRVTGLTRKDGCQDCDKRRDRIAAIGIGSTLCEAQQAAKQRLCVTAQKFCRGGLRKVCSMETIYPKAVCHCCPQ